MRTPDYIRKKLISLYRRKAYAHQRSAVRTQDEGLRTLHLERAEIYRKLADQGASPNGHETGRDVQ
jgi:hypothetical protein